ncbi:ATP-binding cassette subfamily C exporter for protease/lipase [Tepidimonas ignava]|uniref:ATP-binding cassette subfamily C exporter for protease/lipase n=1 Tax=Tepidimonas ignava TaxID=114249 RepID=A0A4R3LCH2_9BURK|nr:type I secretion system permease/ATPase [Tepidimonas ignava]TCS97512.1 ATP-binding cassette subfamily C exporter for protease/lipase [Tepidimonas ignava]TSE22095.1 Type I secretion system ATP-binding protein PrsD [Tepidimonas ignava]
MPQPDAAGQPTPPEWPQVLQDLWPAVRRAWFFAVVASLLLLAPTFYMFEVYGRVVNSRSHMTLAMLTLAVVLAYAVMETLEWARNEVMREAATWFDRCLAPRVVDAIHEGNLRRLGAGTVQPMVDLRVVRDFFNQPAVAAAMEAPVALVFLLILFIVHPWLGWAALVGALIQVALAWSNERMTQPPLSAANRAAIAAQQTADGMLRNAEVVEAMGMLRSIHARWWKQQQTFLDLQALASNRAGAFAALTKWIQTVWGSLLLGLGAWLVLENTLPGGGAMMIVASVLGGRVLAPLVQLVTQWRSVIQARDAWGRLTKLLAQVPPASDALPLPAPRGHVSVEGIVVAPPGTPTTILRSVAFALQPGEALAVVGPSGAGKTTLARALVGLWPSMAGKVRLDGADVYTWRKDELGPHIGYLPQGVELLEGTVAENIARFGEVDMRRVREAAALVGLDALIESLPQGYDTWVGPEGAVLSGGQRQRVALARALYGDPVLVVLDEPNASLDEAGDAALVHAIRTLKARGTTFVVMTHRTSVLTVVDKMLVLVEGAVKAFGPRDDVLAALRAGHAPAHVSATRTA